MHHPRSALACSAARCSPDAPPKPTLFPCSLKSRHVCMHLMRSLASYKYFNMDQAILNALEMFDNLKETGTLAPKRAPHEFGPGDGPK